MITLNLPEGKTDSIEIPFKFDFRRQEIENQPTVA